MNLLQLVSEIVEKKKFSVTYLSNFINSTNPTFRELENSLDYVIRSKKMTSNAEKAYCFYMIYYAIREKSQVPTYPDSKNGCQPKKINNLREFVEYNRNSVFEFIPELEKMLNQFEPQLP